MMYTSARHKISHPALVLEASHCNVGIPSWVSLLPSHHGKGNSSFGTFIHLEKAAIISDLANLLSFGLFCAILHCLVVASTFWELQSIYTTGFGFKRYKPLLFCVGTLPKFLCLRLSAIKLKYLFWPIRAQLLLV